MKLKKPIRPLKLALSLWYPKRLISPREFGYKRVVYGWLWWNFEERR